MARARKPVRVRDPKWADAVRNLNERIEKLRNTEHYFAAILSEADAEWPSSWSWDTDLYGSGVVAWITTDTKEDLAKIVRWFTKRGLRIRKCIPPSQHSSSWSYFMRRRGIEDSPELSLHVSPKSCRRVKVGEETVVREIYETVCD